MHNVDIYVSSLVRQMDAPLDGFISEIKNELAALSANCVVAVFPEYCWRLTAHHQVVLALNDLIQYIKPDLTVIFGTYEFVHNNRLTNNAIVAYNGGFIFIPKTKVLAAESKNNLVSGINPGVIELNCGLKLAVVVCADLWDSKLIYELTVNQKADIIAVPAWTGTTQGNRLNARRDWFALSRTISTQYGVVVAVADHAYNYPNRDVGNATAIFSAEDRSKLWPTTDVILSDRYTINCRNLIAARNRWIDNNIYPS